MNNINELTKNIEAAIITAEDCMEAITNGAASTVEMIKNNADVAHDILESALYDFTELCKGGKLEEKMSLEEAIRRAEGGGVMVKLNRIVMVGDEDNFNNVGKDLYIIDEQDCVGMDGFIAVQYGKKAIYVNKDHIVAIEPESMERW